MDENGSDKTITGLAMRLGRLSAEKRRAALEMSAALAGVSLRVSREFVEAAPEAAKVLSAADMRIWAEMGRKLAMGNVDTGVEFFAEGAGWLKDVPKSARRFVFQIGGRQLILSSSMAVATFRSIPKLASDLDDPEFLANTLELASLIAGRSAKHSQEFLVRTPAVAASLRRYPDDARSDVQKAAFELGRLFANRTGGMTADLWAKLPEIFEGLSAADTVLLQRRAMEILDLGGSVTLYFLASGGKILGSIGFLFEDWCSVLRTISVHGNAVLIGFLRSTPRWVKQMEAVGRREDVNILAAAVLDHVAMLAEDDGESALALFRSSPRALDIASVSQFRAWVEKGILDFAGRPPKARRSYFSLETRESNNFLRSDEKGLRLESIRPVLRMYIEGLTGKEIEVVPMSEGEQGSRIGDGRSVSLPEAIGVFDDEAENFRLFKVLSAYGAGQIEFGTFEKDTPGLKAVFKELSALYEATADEIDAFSLSGYIDDVRSGERSRPDDKPARPKRLPKDSDHRAVLKVFPEPALARKIFGAMENKRIDSALRATYRGLRKDLDLMRRTLAERRPFIFDLPLEQVPFELLFQITLCGGATEDARRFYGQVVSEIESVVDHYFSVPTATVADSLMAASRIYALFQSIASDQKQDAEGETGDERTEYAYDDENSAEAVMEDPSNRERKPKESEKIDELFNAWNDPDESAEPDDIQGSEKWLHNEMPEQPLEPGDEAFAYDEWDRELNDYRVGWSRVIEKTVKKGDRTFVELARSRYRGVISSIRHQFQLMKPENLTRINREIDGEDYDLNALVDFIIDRRADGRQSENIYTKRLRKQRDVAVSILLDQSSSTARTITRNPLQPYTYPGRRIIEIEKEGLVLMSEALEAVGDLYAIYGFTSEGRRNVKFYVVKDFGEKYSDEIEQRIGGITFENNTRLGAAIRHAAAKLLRQESRTKLLIILTDGRPYDHDYGDARYAREDVREALTEAKTAGIIPFCITIDRESEAEMIDLYGDVGYTIIDDVLSLPERMPNIYRRLTS